MSENCITDFYYKEGKAPGGFLHSHKTYQMIYLCRGRIRLEAGEKRYECAAPSLIFIASLEEHRIAALSDGYERYVMSIDSGTAKKVIPNHLLTVFSTHKSHFCHYLDVSAHKEEIDYLIGTLYQEYSGAETEAESGCHIWLSALLNRVYRLSPELFASTYSSSARIILDVKTQLETELDARLSLSELAQQHFISASYLSHLFKAATGYSVNQYRLLCRISQARQLLEKSGLEIQDISRQCGFSDCSDFCRYFKNKVGMTPGGYRAECRRRGKEMPARDGGNT